MRIEAPIDVSAVLQEVRRLVADAVVVEGGNLDPTDGDLLLQEMRCVERAAPVRRREFRAGRIYARRALAQLGIPEQPLIPGPGRAPTWPPGVVGSITHTRDVCVVIVARAPRFDSVGMDVESQESLASAYSIRDMIATPAELNRTYRDASTTFSLLFAIKEAFYKLYYPLTGVFLGHLDVDAMIIPDDHRFVVRIVNPAKPAVGPAAGVDGRFALAGNCVVAYTDLRA